MALDRDSSFLPLVSGIVGVLLGGVIGLIGTKWTLDASAEQARIDRRVEAYADFSSIMTSRFTDVTTEALNAALDGAPSGELEELEVTEVDRQALLKNVTAVTDALFRLRLVGSSDVSRAAGETFSAYTTASNLAQDEESTGEELAAAVGDFGAKLADYVAIASLEFR